MDFNTEYVDQTKESDDGFNDLRAEVKAASTREQLSMAAIAKMAGIGDSTLSAFIAGTYAGNLARVAEKLRNWLASLHTLTRARATVSEIPFTVTKSSAAFLDMLEYAQNLADVVVIAGGAGVGKTTSAEQYRTQHPNVWLLTAEPSLSSSYAMLDYLADAVGVAETAAQKRSRAIATRLKGTNGLLIVDEAQHLSTGAIDQLRSIHDRAKIGLALMGNEEVWSRLDGGGRKAQFAQLFSRVGGRVTTARPSTQDICAILDAAQIEDQTVRKLLKAIAAKPGALRGMVKTLRLARMLATGADEALAPAHVNAAWARLVGEEGR